MTDLPAIVVVTSSFPIRGDGSEAAGAFVADLVEELSSHAPVRVVAPGLDTRCEPWAGDIKVFRYAAPDKPLSTLRFWHFADLSRIRDVLVEGQAATNSAVQAGATRHILALWALPCGHWARRAGLTRDIPYSVWTLGSDIWSLGRIPVVRSYLRRVLRQARWCYSDGLKLAEDTGHIADRDVRFMPSTRRIGSSRAGPPKVEPPYRLLFLGRWHRNKGVDLLIEALRLLHEKDWARIECVKICGGGPMEPLVRLGVNRLRDAGRPVELCGFLDKVAAENVMLWADYLLIPSRVESIPVVFSDAMKLGCPVVSMPVGDLRYLVADGCGVLSCEVNADAYCDAIRAALESSPMALGGGVAGAAERFSLERNTRELYERTIEGGGRV